MTALAPCMTSDGTVLVDFANKDAWTKDSQLWTLGHHYRCLDDATKRGICTLHNLTASPTTGYFWRTDLSLNLSDADALRLDYAIYHADEGVGPGTTVLTLEFSSVTNFSKTLAFTSTNVSGGGAHRRLLLRPSEFTATGGESWSNTMVAMRVGIKMLSTSYGCNAADRFYFDKLVKNPTAIGLVTIGIDTSYKVDTDIYMDALADAGLQGKAYACQIDYGAVGDTNYNTWAQLAALEEAGLKMYPSFTPLLLYSPTDPNRPVPPYPAQDNDYSDRVDLSNSNELSVEHMLEVDARMKRIHDYYGIPWRNDVFIPHNSGYSTYPGYRYMVSSGYKATCLVRADWSSSNKGILHHTVPIVDDFVAWYLYSASGATHQMVLDAIDEVCEHNGRCLNIMVGRPAYSPEWAEADMRAEFTRIKAKQDAGDLLVVSPSEFVELTQRKKIGLGGS